MCDALIGQTFGKLKVISMAQPQEYRFFDRSENRKRKVFYKRVKVVCECGRKKDVRVQNLRTGNTTSCGVCCLIGNKNRKKQYLQNT
jgi:hypothetical protein